MNVKSYIMIHCTIINDDEIIKHLSTILGDVVQKRFPNAKISLKTNVIYWKIPECKELIYNICNTEPIMVHDFITTFNLTWHYSEGMVRDVGTGKRCHEESAIWSKLCNPTEIFLIPEVRWVHIYTWID